jgi:HD-GYP domain-containing protein (c-di-GMP phosphodiesterase class II)
MRLTPVSRAAGLRLARSLPASGTGRVPLLAQGTVITERYASVLATQGIHAVWVDDDLSDGIEPTELLPAPILAETADRVRSALEAARTAFAARQRLLPSTIQDLTRIVDRVASHVLDSPDAALALNDLAAADAYTHRHSINVTALGLLLARAQFRTHGWVDYRGERRYDRMEQRLSTLGLGLLLHDIGKMAVPTDVLNKPGPLDAAEWQMMRTHPEAGVALLGTSTLGPLVTAVIRDHHERMDGSGYPRGAMGDEIHPFARIAAIADVYDAITSARPYKAASAAHVGVQVIAEGAATAFDSEVVATFRRLVFPYPVGTELPLSDGRIGVVASVDPDNPDMPVVRVAGPTGAQEVTVDTRTGVAD